MSRLCQNINKTMFQNLVFFCRLIVFIGRLRPQKIRVILPQINVSPYDLKAIKLRMIFGRQELLKYKCLRMTVTTRRVALRLLRELQFSK